MSGPSNREELTSWRTQRQGQVKTPKLTNQPRDTHQLERTEKWTSQHIQDVQKQAEQVMGTHLLSSTEGVTSQDMEQTKPVMGTHYLRAHWEGISQGTRQTEQVRDTHFLKSTEGRISQYMGTNRVSEGYPPTGDGRRRCRSQHRNKPSK